MTKAPLAELLAWAAIAAAGLTMLISALWTLLRGYTQAWCFAEGELQRIERM
jgi:hypothetical protein